MLNTKPPKKSFHAWQIIVLCFSMICSFYICSVCLQQTSLHSQFPQIVNVSDIAPSPFHPTRRIPLTDELPIVHLPQQTSLLHSQISQIVHVSEIPSPCDHRRIPASELPFVHFPHPKNYKREECVCTPVRLFAILSMQRSGSGWFETLLNSHTNVSSNGEIFYRKERRGNVSSITATLDKVYNLDWSSSAAKKECTAAVGFKWMLNQGLMDDHHNEISKYFKKRGVYVIFLFRRNLLRRHISNLANKHDGRFKPLHGAHKAHVHSREEARILARFKPRIDPASLIPKLETTQRSAVKALKRFKDTNHITLFYEDLVKNRTKLQDVMEFLKVPEKMLKSRQVKIHTKALSKLVKNWDDVHRALKGSRFESFLDSN